MANVYLRLHAVTSCKFDDAEKFEADNHCRKIIIENEDGARLVITMFSDKGISSYPVHDTEI